MLVGQLSKGIKHMMEVATFIDISIKGSVTLMENWSF